MADDESLLGRLEQTEQIMLHLLENDPGEEHWDLGEEVTQKGICDATGLARKHISRPLDRLESSDLLIKNHARPEGYRQRVLVYRLTEAGLESAAHLSDEVLSSTVQRGGGTVLMAELLAGSRSLVSGLRGHDIHGEILEVVSEAESSSGERLLRKVIQTALKDGVLSDDERTLIEELVDQLDMNHIALRLVIDEEKHALEDIATEAEEIYVEMLNTVWSEIGVEDSTATLLDALADSLRLTPQNRMRLESMTRSRHELLTTFPPAQRPYVEAIWTAMADGNISLEEDAILHSLRKSLDIGDPLHSQIVAAIRSLISEP